MIVCLISAYSDGFAQFFTENRYDNILHLAFILNLMAYIVSKCYNFSINGYEQHCIVGMMLTFYISHAYISTLFFIYLVVFILLVKRPGVLLFLHVSTN